MSSSILEKLGLPKSAGGTVETQEKRAPTLRLELTLGKPTDKTFPEFSYAQLAKNALVGYGCVLAFGMSIVSFYSP